MRYFFLLLLLPTLSLAAQDMNNDRLGEILESEMEEVEGGPGNWTFQVGQYPGMCITDESHNRMRIIVPVGDMKTITEEEKIAALYANFHSALDVRYAAADGIMWAAFIHPLKELTEEQVIDALSQVFSAAFNFGTTYTSTDLVFPGGSAEADEVPEETPNESKKDKGRY
ncbi:MAG: hypothetical protein AAF741_08370 [Bacteroidota bacterium]